MRLLVVLGLVGCVEYDYTKTTDVIGGDDTEDEPVPDTVDSLVDTGDTGEIPVSNDCDVTAATAGSVAIDEDCEGWDATTDAVSDPWNATIEWQYTSSGYGVIVMPAVGNLNDDNADGVVDENDTPDIAFSTWYGNTLVALDGATGTEIFEISGFDGQGGTTIADVDSDGQPEIIAFLTGYKIAAVSGTGTVEWRSAAFPMSMYPQPTVADLDNDGDVEVIGDVGVVDGATGSTVTTLGGITNSWRTPVAADLDQDGLQEIILGNVVFNAAGSRLWANSGTGSGNFNAVADVDGDIGGEVFFASGSTMYLHDDDGTLLDAWTIPGTNPGPTCVADFDGDGAVEIAVPANNWISVWETDGTEIWRMPINDSSGLAGCSGFDVDGDGAYEVLFADQDNLFIYDGASGVVNYSNGNHDSATVWEYPVTVDIDNDGSAEIVIASNNGTWQGITVFGHAGDGWPKSGTTWGTHDFGVTNINPDGSVPSPPTASWLAHNVFRARPSVDDSFAAQPDLTVELTDQCVTTCDAGGLVKIAWQVSNPGAADIDAGVQLSLYMVSGGLESLYSTFTLDAIPAGSAIAGETTELPVEDVGTGGYLLRVDDDGTGAGALTECDEDNNTAVYADSICG